MPSDPRFKILLGILALGLVGFVLAHAALGRLARHAEDELGAWLWWEEEWLQLYTPGSFEGRGPSRMMLFGPSEAREGFLREEFTSEFPGWEVYPGALSVGTLEDGIVLLRYLEKAWGAEAVPRRFVMGVTLRFVMNLRQFPSPFLASIDRYSPLFSLERDPEPRLVERGALEALQARGRFLGRQSRRYRRALRASWREALIAAGRAERGDPGADYKLTPGKFHHLPPEDKTQYWEIEERVGSQFFESLRGADARTSAARIRADFDWLRDFAARHDMELFVVNLPEGPWMERFYRAGIYEAYRGVLAEAVGDMPFLDLRDLLKEDEIFDWTHPTRAGAARLSRRVARFVGEVAGHEGPGKGR